VGARVEKTGGAGQQGLVGATERKKGENGRFSIRQGRKGPRDGRIPGNNTAHTSVTKARLRKSRPQKEGLRENVVAFSA